MDSALTLWETPAPVTHLLFETHSPPQGWVIEPQAGDGAIVQVVGQRGHDVWAIEQRSECRSALDGVATHVTIGDWLAIDPSVQGRELLGTSNGLSTATFSIVGNPPYKPRGVMLAHVKHCIDVGPAFCALLLPASFLHSEGRSVFNRTHPVSGYYPLDRRPSCSGDGKNGTRDLAWLVWDQLWGLRQRIKVLHMPRDGA